MLFLFPKAEELAGEGTLRGAFPHKEGQGVIDKARALAEANRHGGRRRDDTLSPSSST